MPAYVPRGMEPYKKRELLEKRRVALHGAINAGASVERVANAAEKVRSAVLAVIKGRRSILDGQRETDELKRQLANLQTEEQRWLSLTVEEIVVLADGSKPLL